MKDKKSNLLLYGIIIGGLIGTGIAIYFSSKFISKTRKNLRERKHKFYEGIDDIFDSKIEDTKEDDTRIDKETEEGIINELFSRTN
jgi:gas vesicle protein